MDAVARIADAVLYEGYLLWPYRRSALKNQRRWTFGGVYPEAHSREHDDDPWLMRTECLLEARDGGDANVCVRVRFLHVVARQVARAAGEALEPVDQLEVAGRRHLSWEEAVERELTAPPLDVAALQRGHALALAIPAGYEEEPLRDERGARAGALIRTWHGLQGSVEIEARRLAPALLRVQVTIANRTPWAGGSRQEALARTFCSTHTVLEVGGDGAFVSLTDPPEPLVEAAQGCRNQGTWPVLVGDPGDRRTVLSSPIILEDHPRIAPESPGDLFDGGEIDQLLTLNILTLTDEEKAEMRDSDPRAREILDRTEALGEEELMRLHGTIRDFRVLRER